MAVAALGIISAAFVPSERIAFGATAKPGTLLNSNAAFGRETPATKNLVVGESLLGRSKEIARALRVGGAFVDITHRA